jgi:hypothetical protein
MISLTHRTIATMLTIATTAMLAAGCGGSSSSADGASAKITKAQFIAYAHAVNLRGSDLPGAVAESTEAEGGATSGEDELARCEGVSTYAREIVQVPSPELHEDEYKVVSDIGTDLRTSLSTAQFIADSAHVRSVERSSRGIACVKSYIQRRYSQSGLSRVEVSSLANPLSGVDGSSDLRFRVTGYSTSESKSSAPESAKTITYKVVLYDDFFLLDVGRATIELQVEGTAKEIPLATERRLLSLLYSRAKAHSV